MIKVCKFGGTSMADGITALRVKRILEADPARRYVVVSAPGKRYSGDIKITDLLLETAQEVKEGGHVGDAYAKVAARFRSLVKELSLGFEIEPLLEETARQIEQERSADFCASRGEYLSGRIMAALLGVPFIDAKDVIKFEGGHLDGEKSYSLVREALKGKRRAVVAGFYGEDERGHVKTFPRGGSDITGAVVARAVGADEYENWTDVSGFLACDPRIVPGAVGIDKLSYKELRELSYMGANVLHAEAVYPVREANIPIRILNTFRPQDAGTRIVSTEHFRPDGRTVTGIAGKKDFTVIFIEKAQMNEMSGFALRPLEVLKRHDISFEHMPSGIDTLSFVIDSNQLKGGVLAEVLAEIEACVAPDKMNVIENIALIAVVGHGMNRNVGTAARLFRAIARAGVNVRLIDQGSSELNIIVGVDNENYERSIKAVYDEFFGPDAA